MVYDVLLETNLPLPIFKKEKVRDIYDLDKRLLIVSTDRISAFDVVLPNGVSHKGEVLNRLSVYWFNQTKNIIPNQIYPKIQGLRTYAFINSEQLTKLVCECFVSQNVFA